jgi:hypothetical protein
VVTIKDNGVLTGMKEICVFMNRSENSVLTLIRREGFPAKKIQGIWYSDRALIKAWADQMLERVVKLKYPQIPSNFLK